MDYFKKLEQMDNHLKRHPKDYQTVISRMKVASDAYDYELKKRRDRRLARLAEVRRQMKEIRDGEKR